jgi:16S rRNA (adenine1518-N6/adenine1519-N6)-dimethyltransferase
MDINRYFSGNLAVTGNLPYNISTQIMFRVLEYRNKVTEVTGMLQKEVAERICAGPGSKTYGILSVLLQAYYKAEYLFTVPPEVFIPPPKVKSGVIRLRRLERISPECNEELLFRVVKAGFNQRRKTLRNSMRAAFELSDFNYPDLNLRPEQLSVDQFIRLTNWVESARILSE